MFSPGGLLGIDRAMPSAKADEQARMVEQWRLAPRQGA